MDVLAWLLDSDPAIRWQVLRDLAGASEEEVTAERARVATEGWGADLLALQAPDDLRARAAARLGAGGGSDHDVRDARLRGEAYLLVRRLFRRRSDGRVVDPRFTMLSYPTWWYYDILRALDHLRAASELTGVTPDPRCEEAIGLVRAKRLADGRWPNELTHEGPTFLRLEASEGSLGRWATLRALRVLAWWDGATGARDPQLT